MKAMVQAALRQYHGREHLSDGCEGCRGPPAPPPVAAKVSLSHASASAPSAPVSLHRHALGLLRLHRQVKEAQEADGTQVARRAEAQGAQVAHSRPGEVADGW